MKENTPGWKVLLAIFSILLTVLVWQRGLQESFDRPSVSPRLVLNSDVFKLARSEEKFNFQQKDDRRSFLR